MNVCVACVCVPPLSLSANCSQKLFKQKLYIVNAANERTPAGRVQSVTKFLLSGLFSISVRNSQLLPHLNYGTVYETTIQWSYRSQPLWHACEHAYASSCSTVTAAVTVCTGALDDPGDVTVVLRIRVVNRTIRSSPLFGSNYCIRSGQKYYSTKHYLEVWDGLGFGYGTAPGSAALLSRHQEP